MVKVWYIFSGCIFLWLCFTGEIPLWRIYLPLIGPLADCCCLHWSWPLDLHCILRWMSHFIGNSHATMKSLWWFPWPFLPIRNSWDSTILTSALTPKEEDSGYLKLDRAPVYVYARRWEGSAETDPHANFQRGLALPVLLFSIQRISQIETGQSRAGLTSPSWRPTDILLGFKVHNCSLFPLSQSLSLSFFNTLENNINPISQKKVHH